MNTATIDLTTSVTALPVGTPDQALAAEPGAPADAAQCAQFARVIARLLTAPQTAVSHRIAA